MWTVDNGMADVLTAVPPWLGLGKETTLERADFALQLLMFVTAEKERVMFIIFLSFHFLSAVVPKILS